MNRNRAALSLVFGAALAAALVLVFSFADGASAQTPTPPTPEGLGSCLPEHTVEILNDSANITPEQTVIRESNGGFEAIFVTNCIIFAINYGIVDQFGETVPGGVGTRYVHEQYSEIDYVPHSQYIEHERYTVDYPDSDTRQYENTCAGDPVKDEQGIAIQADRPEPVTAYHVKFTYTNPPDGVLGGRPFDKNFDSANFELAPYIGARENEEKDIG